MNINYNKIVQFSPIRSGSTLVYNILKNIFVDEKIEKMHNFKYRKGFFYVIAIRHPYNSIISSILRYGLKINEETIEKQLNQYLENGGNDIINKNLKENNIITFMYQDFKNNFEIIYNKLEEKLNINISSELREKINKLMKIDNVIKIASKFDNFGGFDKNNHIHGNHISKYKGETDYKQILTENQLNILKTNDNLNMIIKKFKF